MDGSFGEERFGSRHRAPDIGGLGSGLWDAFDQLRGMFEQRPSGTRMSKGDVRAAVLTLLAERPMHGYQIIQEIEERRDGSWKPSPGSVYPTLQMLEDLGYVTASQQEGKKVYAITDEGRKYLDENRRSVDAIWGRVGGGWDPQAAAEMHEIRHDLMALGKLFGQKMHEGKVDREKLARVRAVISTATREIEDILRDQDDPGTTRA